MHRVGVSVKPDGLWKIQVVSASHIPAGGALRFQPTPSQWQILSEAGHQLCGFLQ